MCMFIAEVKKIDGTEYPGKPLSLGRINSETS